MVAVEIAIKNRMCRLCGNIIEIGEKHVCFRSPIARRWVDNVCHYCLGKLYEEVRKEG